MRRKGCVQVNEGSGCLFKLYNSTYDYVLTAKHLLNDCNNIEWKNPVSNTNETIEVIGKPLVHEGVDAAILQVQKVTDLQDYIITTSECNEQRIVLAGFPKCRTAPNKFRFDYGVTHETNDDGVLELEIAGIPEFDEIDGMSGGPVTKRDSSNELIAIQCEMTNRDDKENLGRTSAVPTKFFEEIITNANNNDSNLESLTTVTLELLTDHTFKLKDMTLNKELVSRCLKRKAEIVADTLSIEDIINVYGNCLSVNSNNIFDKDYWIGFLEVLSVVSFKNDGNIDSSKLEQLKETLRVVYCEVDGLWLESIPVLYNTDLKDLKKDSTVFIVTNKNRKPTRTEYPPNVLMEIDKVPMPDEMQIDNASITDPFSEIKIKHIYSVQEVMIYKEDILMNCSAGTVVHKIKEIANDFI
ncbi:ABC-three component system protein [Vibrio rarus]|uniref:ABC-three component system protein n=1 Tax=Vibrio rarus TaxID=413403 RepID=UPI0021C3328F|nr:ABC-three component system protein [Vibrio rarus]